MAAEREAMQEMRFTVRGGFSGEVYAADVDLEVACSWARSYFLEPRRELIELPVGHAWQTHESAQGIRIARIR